MFYGEYCRYLLEIQARPEKGMTRDTKMRKILYL